MIRRPTLLTVFTAVLVLAGRTALVCADGINPNASGTESFRLTDPAGIPAPNPNATAPQVIAKVIPAGSVVPPALTNPDGSVQTNSDGSPKQGSPLTILSDSHGFDQNNLVVGLDGTNPGEQLFGLAFNKSGLASDGVLHFALAVDKSLSTPPQLESLTPGVAITSDQKTTPSTPSTAAGGPVAVNTPEPLSVLVWSVLVSLGLLRARTIRRSHASLG